MVVVILSLLTSAQLVVKYSHKVIFATVSRLGKSYIMGMDFGAVCTTHF